MNSAKKNIETPEQFYSYWQQYKELSAEQLEQLKNIVDATRNKG